jgi:hypothetical protein
MGPVLRSLARKGMRRGLLGGSRTWLVIGISATGLRVAARLLARRPEVVFSTELHAGERLQITALPPD